MVWVTTDPELVVVSEPQYYMHGCGQTLEEAVQDFRTVLIDEVESLRDAEGQLGPQLQSQLTYLSSIITAT